MSDHSRKKAFSLENSKTHLSLVAYSLKHTLIISAIAKVIHQNSNNRHTLSMIVLLNTAVTGQLSSQVNWNS